MTVCISLCPTLLQPTNSHPPVDSVVCHIIFQTMNETNSLLLFPPIQSVMEQFNPGLRNLVNLGKNYEKSVAGEYFYYYEHAQ